MFARWMMRKWMMTLVVYRAQHIFQRTCRSVLPSFRCIKTITTFFGLISSIFRDETDPTKNRHVFFTGSIFYFPFSLFPLSLLQRLQLRELGWTSLRLLFEKKRQFPGSFPMSGASLLPMCRISRLAEQMWLQLVLRRQHRLVHLAKQRQVLSTR